MTTSERTEPDISAILEAERELVVRTQSQYRALKEKYLELKDQYELATKELAMLRNELAADELSRHHLAELGEKSHKLVLQLEEDNKLRQIAHEQFKTETLAEVQRVFRKELEDQAKETQQIIIEKEQLIEENDRLLEEIRELRSEIVKLGRDRRNRERELISDFSQKAESIIAECEGSANSSREHEIIAVLKERISALEHQFLEAEQRHGDQLLEKHEELSRMKLEVAEQQMKCIDAKKEAERRTEELFSIQQQLQFRDQQLESLKKDLLQLQNEKDDLELKIIAEKRKTARDQHEESLRFDEQIQKLENEIRKRDRLIQEMEESVEKAEQEANYVNELERSQLIEKEQRELVEKEFKRLIEDIEEREVIIERKMNKMKQEKAKLSHHISVLKQKLEITPGTATDAARLRKALAQKEQEEIQLKDHYRQLLRKMKNSLTKLEKKHNRVQQKLDESILL